MAKASKETRIKRETARLHVIFQDLDKNKLEVVEALIARAAYITVSLEDLEKEIDETGFTETYSNGKDQSGVKQSAAAALHVSMTKNLTAIMKQLIDLTPTAKKGGKLEEMMGK